ncbi:hypothetical protein [Streptomyces aureoversilis]|uniref:Lipoprotein n=1 Tax=Streptomyces aureoversilis TaxID=67277 RepID=A0ABV9ZVL4_9ACTN
MLSLALVVSTAGCSHGPDDRKLRSLAVSDQARARRAQQEHKLQALVGRLGSVTGLDYAFTRFRDDCARPGSQALWGSDDPEHSLVCDMEAVAYFGVRDDMTDVLPRIRAASLAQWGLQDENGEDLPYARGSVRYALDYYRNHGKYPDGRNMSPPELQSPDLTIAWDVAPYGLVEEAPGCPPPRYLYLRCDITPEATATVRAVRAKYGTVLAFRIGQEAHSSWRGYYTVPRKR